MMLFHEIKYVRRVRVHVRNFDLLKHSLDLGITKEKSRYIHAHVLCQPTSKATQEL